MANQLLDEFLQVFRAAGLNVSNKLRNIVSYLVHHKNAGTVGAIAGLAIALVCTYRYMKSASGRRPKPGVKLDGSSSSNTTSGSSTAVASRSSQLKQRGVAIQEVASRVSLSESVKRQLKGGRKVTCQLLGVVLQEAATDELESHAVVRPAVTEVLFELAQLCDLYLMTRVNNDASEENVLAALEKIGIFATTGLNRNKVLFCSSEAGRSSFVRQIEPDWHIDTSAEIISQLARYIHHQLLVSPVPSGAVASNVFEAESLEGYFDRR